MGMDATVTFYRKREEDLLKFFENQCNFVYCCNIPGLVTAMGASCYDPTEWHLFIDNSKKSLKCVYCIQVIYLVQYPQIIHHILKKDMNELKQYQIFFLKYEEHKWIICVDIKMANFLLQEQSGYTKFPCFLCP